MRRLLVALALLLAGGALTALSAQAVPLVAPMHYPAAFATYTTAATVSRPAIAGYRRSGWTFAGWPLRQTAPGSRQLR